MKMKICGPKLSICGLVMSAWGVIQLALLGLFYYMRSVNLAEDVTISNEDSVETQEDLLKFYQNAEDGYHQNAYNCWAAAILYVVTLLLSGHQFYVNFRSSA